MLPKFHSQSVFTSLRIWGSQSSTFFSKENTFWAFFSQVLGDDGGCQEVIRKLQAFAAMKSKPLPSSSTAAYCQARSKLDLPGLETILRHTANRLLTIPDSERMNGRRVIVVDGTGVSMPDTIASQLVWPQQRHQKAGCGFPASGHLCLLLPANWRFVEPQSWQQEKP